MARFSEKELTLLKTFYLRQETALKEGLKVKKAQLYRDIYNSPDMKPQSANTAFNLILKRFEALPTSEQNQYLSKWQLKAKEEEIETKVENLKLMKAYTEGKEEAIKKYDLGYQEGLEQGKKAIKLLESAINLEDEDGRRNFLEHLATRFLADYDKQLKCTLRTEEGEYITNGVTVSALIKGLIDIAKINQVKDKDALEILKELKNLSN